MLRPWGFRLKRNRSEVYINSKWENRIVLQLSQSQPQQTPEARVFYDSKTPDTGLELPLEKKIEVHRNCTSKSTLLSGANWPR